MFTALEPCWSYSVRGDRGTKRLGLKRELRKCLHVYHYYQHPLVGLMYARVQTWFPFTVQVGLNGREWRARSLAAAGLPYRRRGNTFTWVQDFAKAQALLDEQLTVSWSELLDEVRGLVHPAHAGSLGKYRADYYYWSLLQSEWATDVVFKDRTVLAARYEPWLRFALTSFASPDVLRFLGKKLTADGRVNGHFAGGVLSDLGRRVDGMRIKHRVGKNSVKRYDKAATVLRVETTVDDPGAFKVYRPKASDPDGGLAWQAMRAGVADLHRRAEVSQASNERYLGCVAAVAHAEPLATATATAKLSRRVKGPGGGGRKARGLNPLSDEDAALLAVVGRPEYGVEGLRNRDVVAGLYDKPPANAEEGVAVRRG